MAPLLQSKFDDVLKIQDKTWMQSSCSSLELDEVFRRLEIFVGDVKWIDLPEMKTSSDIYLDIVIPTSSNADSLLAGTMNAITLKRNRVSKFNQIMSFQAEKHSSELYLIFSRRTKSFYGQVGIAMARVPISFDKTNTMIPEITVMSPCGRQLGVANVNLKWRCESLE